MTGRLLQRVAWVLSLTALAAAASAQAPQPQSDPHAGHTDATQAPVPRADPKDLPAFIPKLTDEDRQAAFPELEGHPAHDRTIHSFVLFDQLEWLRNDCGDGLVIDSKGWIGGDRDRLWFRSEGGGEGGRVDDAKVHLLWGRQISRWWDVVGGIRQDFRPGLAQTWAAAGVQGLAPYWFEVEATSYVASGGRTHARFEVEYELLLSNRLIAQPLAEIDVFGKSDPERGIGAGLSATDFGIRVRYEIRREFAPYAGVVWHNKWGKTAEFAEAAGESAGGARLVTGLRLWF